MISPLVHQVRDDLEQRRLLAAMLCRGGCESGADLADQRAFHPQAARLIPKFAIWDDMRP